MKVLGFGDNIIDWFVDRSIVYPGGNSVNFAVFARQLGVEASYLGVFGSDAGGAFLRQSISSEGVDLSHSAVRAGKSGVSTLTVIDGERTFGGWNGGGVTVSKPLQLDDELLAYVADFDLVHSSVYSRSEPELPKLRKTRTLVSFDLSSEDEFRSADYLDRVVPFADLVLFSCSDLSPAQTRSLLTDGVARGAGLALGTRGTKGAIAYDGRCFVEGVAQPLEDPSLIVDTMGCGDAFLTAFAVTLLRTGWSRRKPPSADAISAALRGGAGFAASQCLVEGAFGHGTDDSLVPATM
ncbi:PfkB family carbohydrate kinase [Saxibacter everestensis]|uniref:PfkB family carbohydrate kinase n=1 Tax=Saxibacter everestensis TaxID=2909229 RepID=A0ABY8QW38_9MICO|nr:PfkB family carbohydrate kinase [Brevibacteriaceae bacterium ZFBP1038]